MATPPPLDQSQADALVRLSIGHSQQQVGKVARVQAELRRLWNQVLDPKDFAGSYTRFALGASYLIQQARSDAMPLATRYFRDSQEIAGYTRTEDDKSPLVVINSLEADLTALYVTGFVTIQKQLASGASADFAERAGQASMLRSAQRRILDAPRQGIIDRSVEDDATVGWARVGDGAPCYFCAMLISRGPVYSERTVNFRAHDGCGCGAKMCFRNDPSRGWTDQSRLLRGFYDENKADWRSAYGKAMKDPESPVRQAMNAVPRADYGLAA
jgi:hypothetical protein